MCWFVFLLIGNKFSVRVNNKISHSNIVSFYLRGVPWTSRAIMCGASALIMGQRRWIGSLGNMLKAGSKISMIRSHTHIGVSICPASLQGLNLPSIVGGIHHNKARNSKAFPSCHLVAGRSITPTSSSSAEIWKQFKSSEPCSKSPYNQVPYTLTAWVHRMMKGRKITKCAPGQQRISNKQKFFS